MQKFFKLFYIISIVEKILSSGALYFARKGEFDSVIQLIRKNTKRIQINEVDRECRTILSYASEKGDPNLTRLCLTLKADPRISDKNGVSPLMYSSKNGNTECTETISSTLLGRESINFLDKEGWTALMHGARFGRRCDVIILLRKGADKTLKNKENLDSRAIARINGWKELSIYIKEYTNGDVKAIKKELRK